MAKNSVGDEEELDTVDYLDDHGGDYERSNTLRPSQIGDGGL